MNHHRTIRQWLRADGTGKRFLRVDYHRHQDGRWHYAVVGCAWTLRTTSGFVVLVSTQDGRTLEEAMRRFAKKLEARDA